MKQAHYIEAITDCQLDLGTNYSINELSEDLLTKLVKEKYDSLDLTGRIMTNFRDSDKAVTKQDKITTKSYQDFLVAISMLEYYLRYHFTTFKETEDVYRWAKHICEDRMRAMNRWRGTLNMQSFDEWYKNNN